MSAAHAAEPWLKRLSVPGLIVAGAMLLTALAHWTGMLTEWELFLYDQRLKGTPALEVSDRILPMPIDDSSTARLGRWPWPRPRTAELALGLTREGARVVMLDLTYKDRTSPAEDREFVETIAGAGAAVAAYSALEAVSRHDERTTEEHRTLAAFEGRIPVAIEGAAKAFPDAPLAGQLFLPIRGLVERGPGLGLATLDSRADSDGVVRRMPMLYRYRPIDAGANEEDRRWLPSLSLMLACRWYGVDPADVIARPGRLILPNAAPPGEPPREVVIPVDAGGRMLVRYAKPGVLASRFRSVYSVLNSLSAGESPERDRSGERGIPKVRGRIALVYLSTFGSGDLHATPTAKNYPGGLINGETLNTIITGQFTRTPPAWVTILLLLGEGVILTGFAARWRSYRLGLASLGLLFVVFTAGFIAFRSMSLMVPLAPLSTFVFLGGVGVVVWRTWLEDRERVDLLFTLRALQNQALKERRAAQRAESELSAAISTTVFTEEADALRRNVEYGRFIESLRDIESLENTYIGKHYRLLNLIDEGGMGLVFRAYDEALERVVAIKVLTRYSSKMLKRFQVEARAVGQLRHPNVVQVHAVAAEGDIPYIVMEYVSGTSLSQRIRDDGPLPIGAAAEVLLQVARGLDAAHLRQIIHRDIKTSNVLLAADGTAKIIDFGIAKFFKGEGEGLTGEKEVVGTADYMSPEQGSGRPVDARSDIYSLGITLFRILTGRLPFRAEETMAVLLKQMRDPLPDIRVNRADVPEELIEIMVKMAEKRPEDRYQNCQELCIDLEAFLHRYRARIESGEAGTAR